MTNQCLSGLLTLALVGLVTPPAQGLNCNKKANRDLPECQDPGGGGGGGGGTVGSEKVPSVITFREDATDAITTDQAGMPYLDSGLLGGDDYVEAFIGSQANVGNIFLKIWNPETPANVNRLISIDLSQQIELEDDGCSIPDEEVYKLQFLKVDVDGELSNGIYDLDEVGAQQDTTTRLRFVDSQGQVNVLNFGTGERKLCGDASHGSSRVMVTREAVNGEPDVTDPGDIWSVEGIAVGGNVVGCLEQPGSGGPQKAKFCGTFEMPFRFTIEPGETP